MVWLILDITKLAYNRRIKFVVMASDGFFEVMTNESLANLINTEMLKDTPIQDIAELCTNEALELGSEDNLTILILSITKKLAKRMKKFVCLWVLLIVSKSKGEVSVKIQQLVKIIQMTL